MLLVRVESIKVEFFSAKTAQGHTVIVAYGKPICIVLNNGACFKRLKYTQAAIGHRVDVELQGKEIKTLDECSEREWMAVEDMAGMISALPPKQRLIPLSEWRVVVSAQPPSAPEQ